MPSLFREREKVRRSIVGPLWRHSLSLAEQWPVPEMEKRYLNIKELVEQANVSSATIWRLKAAGKIPFYQPGGKGCAVRFPLDAIERAVEASLPAPRARQDDSSAERLSGPQPDWMNTSRKQSQ